MTPDDLTNAPEESRTDRRVAELENKLSDRERQEIERERNALANEVRQLQESGKVPYWDEVMPEMRTIHAGRVSSGQEPLGPMELYEAACSLNRDVRGRLESAAAEKSQRNSSAERARKAEAAAKATVRTTATPAAKVKPKDPGSLEDALGRAWDETQKQQELTM